MGFKSEGVDISPGIDWLRLNGHIGCKIDGLIRKFAFGVIGPYGGS